MSKLSAPPTGSSASAPGTGKGTKQQQQQPSVGATTATTKSSEKGNKVLFTIDTTKPPKLTSKEKKMLQSATASASKHDRQLSKIKSSGAGEKLKGKPPPTTSSSQKEDDASSTATTTTTSTTKSAKTKPSKIEKVKEDAQVSDKPHSPPSAAALARKKRKKQIKAREGKLFDIPEDASLPQMIKLVGRHKLFRGEKRVFDEQMNSATEKKQYAIPKAVIARIVRAILNEQADDASKEHRSMFKDAVQVLHEAAEAEIVTIMHLANQNQLAAATIEQPWIAEDGTHHIQEKPVLPGTTINLKAATFRVAAATVAGDLGVWGRRDINNAVPPTHCRLSTNDDDDATTNHNEAIDMHDEVVNLL